MWSRWSIGSSGWVSKHVKKHHPGPNTILKGWLFWHEWYMSVGMICFTNNWIWHLYESWFLFMVNVWKQCNITIFLGNSNLSTSGCKAPEKKQVNFSLMNLLLPYPLFFSSHLRFTWYFLMIPVQVFISHVCYYMLAIYVYICTTSPMVSGTATERYWQTLVGKVRRILCAAICRLFLFWGGLQWLWEIYLKMILMTYTEKKMRFRKLSSFQLFGFQHQASKSCLIFLVSWV